MIWIVLLISLSVFVLIMLILAILYLKRWPLKFYITNTGNKAIDVTIRMNETTLGKQTLQPKKETEILIGNNYINSKTQQVFKRNQVVSVTIYTENPIKFRNGNVPYPKGDSSSNRKVILSSDNIGYGKSVLYYSKGDGLYKQKELSKSNLLKEADSDEPISVPFEKVQGEDWLIGGNWTKKGYYIILFPDGIPTF